MPSTPSRAPHSRRLTRIYTISTTNTIIGVTYKTESDAQELFCTGKITIQERNGYYIYATLPHHTGARA